jgi:anti-sigma factor RsiW
MTMPDPLSEKDRTDLVAYLDGELDEEAARSLESRLNQNPTMRAEADSLRRTWELLDYLPRAEPSSSFTNRTLDRIVTQPSRALSPIRRRWLLWGGWAAAVLLAAVGGYLTAVALVPARPTEQDLIRELRLIENLRLYEPVENLEFLRELDHRDLFGEDPLDS